MFSNATLKTYLETATSVHTRSLIIAEWNMNMTDNISAIGNYRHRPGTTGNFSTIQSTYFADESARTLKDYTGATDSYVTLNNGYTGTTSTSVVFSTLQKKNQMIYSLQDCFGRFRPRSGSNKIMYFPNRYLFTAPNALNNPRYYAGSGDDVFKYWTSYRTEESTGIVRGIAKDSNYIDDTAPFVVYKNKIPTNRIIVKMQTHVTDTDNGSYTLKNGTTISDPFYGTANKAVPSDWKIQYLDSSNNWATLKGLDGYDLALTESDIGTDGYIELAYGLNVPAAYTSNFTYAGELSSVNALPTTSITGYAYLIKATATSIGTFSIWNGGGWDTLNPVYGWYVNSGTKLYNNIYSLVNPPSYVNNSQTLYREFQYINGLRVVVNKMNKADTPFELIELSPRMSVDLTEKIENYKITKIASDLHQSGLPVGELLASTGSANLFDFDLAFNENNPDSILNVVNSGSVVYNFSTKNLQLKFWDIIVDDSNNTYYVPIKVMYVDGFPSISNAERKVDLTLRDLYFYFESMIAPQLLLRNVKLSFIVAALFDSIGFSNFVTKRIGSEDPIIPSFFVAPDTSVTQVLNDLARATQTAMFFDEYNNFVLMSKEYMLPSSSSRTTDFVLSGETNPNIVSISSENDTVYNDGKITYTNRYIQRSYGTINEASLLNNNQRWNYKPVLLWEISPTENIRSINEETGSQSSYALSAIPLNSDRTISLPTVSSGTIINNTLDFGESIYWLARYNGYLYSNGEIIKFDAIQYSVSGLANPVWVQNNQDYAKYFGALPFGGQMFPTGLVRIYAEPYYNADGSYKNGAVANHGRGQFGTNVVGHTAGIDSYWTNSTYKKGFYSDSSYLFENKQMDKTLNFNGNLITVPVADGNSQAQKTIATGIMKNFSSNTYVTDSNINQNKITAGTIQASALVMRGGSFLSYSANSGDTKPRDHISYIYKNLDNNKYTHFGTRMRIVGEKSVNASTIQNPYGKFAFYNSNQMDVQKSDESSTSVVSGASGGIAVMLDPTTHFGYYFEIAALTENNISNYSNTQGSINNVFFYKIGTNSGKGYPSLLYQTAANIVVDDGKFTGQARMTGEKTPSVYDLAVEYDTNGPNGGLRFFLYINDKVVAVVNDENPLRDANGKITYTNNTALFIRGSSKVMFENIYALSSNYGQNTSSLDVAPVSGVFGVNKPKTVDSFRKYLSSGMIRSTYQSTINGTTPPEYNIYFDEFGTIMRECAYFNIRYDKAYPALWAKMSPTFNALQGYTVSGFSANPYGAEFLIFNNTDTVLNLDETSGNYLRIQGVTFTQQSNHDLTVDDFFVTKSNMSTSSFNNSLSPVAYQKTYADIRNSRAVYGKNQFTLDSPYIQNRDEAENLMDWLTQKVMKPRKSVGVEIFSTPILQLGDIVTIDYTNVSSTSTTYDEISNGRFVIYNIEYSRDGSGPSMTVYLSEVT
jgi:hypothetical protein